MRAATRAGASLIPAMLACSACTGGHNSAQSSYSRPPRVAIRFPSPTLTPTFSGPSLTTCGSWLIRATTPRGTFPLLSCAVTAGVPAVPTVSVKVGDEVLISTGGTARISLAPSPANRVKQSGYLFLVTTPGRTTVSVTGWYCDPIRPGNGQPKSCPLLTIVGA